MSFTKEHIPLPNTLHLPTQKPASLLRQDVVYEDESLKSDLNKDTSEATLQQAEGKSSSPPSPLLSLGELLRLQLSPDCERRKVTRVTSDQGSSCAVKVGEWETK